MIHMTHTPCLDLPSPFSMKLRRAVRGKRLENVRQLGDDRVVNFKFGSGNSDTIYTTNNTITTITVPNIIIHTYIHTYVHTYILLTSGDFVHHVILELYSNGNIILTDGNYEVCIYKVVMKYIYNIYIYIL
jgi:predicted ribosome quality control (RQC) complex YloA/Tae2 family protein